MPAGAIKRYLMKALERYRAAQKKNPNQAPSNPRAIDAAFKILERKKRMQEEMNP